MDIVWVLACVRDGATPRVALLPALWDKGPGQTARDNSTSRGHAHDTVFVRGMSAIVFPFTTAAQVHPAISQPIRNEAVLAGLVLFFVPFVLIVSVALVCYLLHRMAARSWRA
jgi:hypothetical protein